MQQRDSRKKTAMKPVPDVLVHLVGGNELQNELLGWYLETEEGLACIPQDRFEVGADGDAGIHLILFDCLGADPAELWNSVERMERDSPSLFFVALFNANNEDSITREALARKARGIFYRGATLSSLVKGIAAILEGELWYSREVLSQFLMEPKSPASAPAEGAEELTLREKEILFKIAAGESNKEIADGLFISLHTVKSHIYNIYRKIGVENRMRAAHWVARHLKGQSA